MNQDKQLLLDEIKDQINKCGTFLITEYKQLNANKANEFRNEMAKFGSSFEVVKKRLFLKALSEMGMKMDDIKDARHVAVIFAPKDVFESSKIVIKFCEENEQAFSFLGGRIDGAMISSKDAARLATLPSKDELRAQFLQILEMPLTGTLSLFDAALSGVVSCLEEKAKKG